MDQVLKEWWGAIATAVGAVVWLARLEAKGVWNAREIARLWEQRKEDLASAKESRDATNSILKEMQADIKALLARK